jgi:tRNA A58 N-methylase Trm61
MLFSVYRTFLKLPDFTGKSRIAGLLRRRLATPAVRVHGGVMMELDPTEWTQVTLMTTRIIEPITSHLIQQLLPNGGTFVDVGAHVGFHTINAAKSVGNQGTVVAIDPQPYNCERLLRNCFINDIGNVTVHVAAVGSQDGFVVLRNQPATDK